MSTQPKNVVATKEIAEEYIRTTLINSKLEMKQACEELGWSFPRIRSKAATICKKLGGKFVKESRGVYFLQTDQNVQNPESRDVPGMIENSTKSPLTAEAVEAAVMQNLEDNAIPTTKDKQTTEE